MSTPRQQTAQCPNCGGRVDIAYANRAGKLLECEFCHTQLEVAFEDTPERDAPQQIVLHIPTHSMRPVQTASTQASGRPCLAVLVLVAVGLVGLVAALANSGALEELADEVTDNLGVASATTIESDRQFGEMERSVRVVAHGGTYVAAADLDGFAVWDAQTNRRVMAVETNFGADLLHFLGGDLLLVHAAGDLTIYNVETGEVYRELGTRYRQVAVASDNERFAFVDYDNNAGIADLASGEVRTPLTGLGEDTVLSLALSHANRYLAAGDTEGVLTVWDVETGDIIFQAEIQETPFSEMAFSPEEDTLVISGVGNELLMYVINDGTLFYEARHTIAGEGGDLFSMKGIAFSPDGQYLAAGNFFDGVYVWDIADEDVAYRLTNDSGIEGVAFSPDGTVVLGGASDQQVYEWKLD